MAAAQMGLTAALNKLIEYGCDIGQVDNNQHDTLCYALVETTEHHLECLRTCLDQEEKYYKNTMSILLAIEKGEGNSSKFKLQIFSAPLFSVMSTFISPLFSFKLAVF